MTKIIGNREANAIKPKPSTIGFRPRIDGHTLRTYGQLVGMLLLRSFDRSERIVAAMKCRGFRGRFYLMDHFAFSRSDLPFCILAAVLLGILIWEWGWLSR